MDARDFTTDSRLLDLMPAIHASLTLFNSSNNADAHALILAYMLEQLVNLIEDYEHEGRSL